ncbi:sulfur carrier protein ThiS [Peptococcaceae bacterium]|nr:sulfur carrier protein ThiS [Peptococcaceae bacterium]
MIEVKINGKKELFEKDTLLIDFLKQKGVNVSAVVVEYNGSIVPREDISKILLRDGDRVEVLHLVGGG